MVKDWIKCTYTGFCTGCPFDILRTIYFNVIYRDAAHDRDVSHSWQLLHNQMYT